MFAVKRELKYLACSLIVDFYRIQDVFVKTNTCSAVYDYVQRFSQL